MHIFHKWEWIEPGFDANGCFYSQECKMCHKKDEVRLPPWLWTETIIVEELRDKLKKGYL